MTHRCEGRVECEYGKSFLGRIIAKFASLPPTLKNGYVTCDIE